MAWENGILDLSFVAAEDLSNDQHRFVVLSTTGVRRPDSETEGALGILQNAPGAGEAASVRILGVSKLVAGGALGVGIFVMPEYVSATDAGKGASAASALAYARAMVIGAAGAEDDLATVLLTGQVPGITQTGWHTTAVATITTADAVTYTAAQVLGGLILRDCAGGARSDVTPTAAQIVAGSAGCIVGTSFEFTIRNTSDAAETLTITAGAGVTLSGTMTIAQSNSKRFLAVITSITAASEAVTLYSLGTVVH